MTFFFLYKTVQLSANFVSSRGYTSFLPRGNTDYQRVTRS
jgi:hypothetical protein